MATTQDSKESKLDALKKKFQSQLEGARKKLDDMNDKVASAREQDREELGKQRDEIHQRVEEQGKRMQELRDNLKDWQKETSTHTKDKVTSWRQKLELDKLRGRAEGAEDSAATALVIAMLDVDAAEEAVLEAISARIDFETASPSPAP